MEIKAEKREVFGKKNRELRDQGRIPAILYGPDFKPESISINLKEAKLIYQKAGESTVIDLKVKDEAEPHRVLIKDVQWDPVTDDLIHIDFYKANLSEKVSVSIPVRVVGESPIVKSGAGIVLTLLSEIEVEALPLDLPHEVEVNVSSLTEIGQSVTVKDLPIDHTKVKVLEHHPEDLVVKIDYAVQIEKEVEVKDVEEVEVLKEKSEGESAGEGATEAKEESKGGEKENPPAGLRSRDSDSRDKAGKERK